MLDLEELKTLKSLIDKMCIQPLDYLEYRKLQYLLMKYEICYRKENGYRSLYPLCGTSFYDEKILFLSDSHKGSEYEQDKALDIAYNEALKQNIKTSIHLGDIVEGTLRDHDKPKDVVEAELDNALKRMPEEMKTWLLVGNHDYSAFRSYPELLDKFFST